MKRHGQDWAASLKGIVKEKEKSVTPAELQLVLKE